MMYFFPSIEVNFCIELPINLMSIIQEISND
jgi:hypothetical protein